MLGSLEGAECTFCGDGELIRETYNGNDAVVCPECGVPSAQIWS
ncbi:HVO_A0556 family zinc finger protein [Halosolutus halophilus]|nr:HVO_A0556 family zinc finger protein [Halosolutus halophilus]